MGKNQKTSKVWKMPTEEFKELCKNSKTFSEIFRHFGYKNNGNFNTLKKRIKLENIDISHIPLGQNSNKGRKFESNPFPLEQVLVVNSTYARHLVKKRIINQKLIPYVCLSCGNTGEWLGKKLSLQLEHKNGVSNDNRLENLGFLCPNCHSQTDTFSGNKNRK